MIKNLYTILFALALPFQIQAGNPDRQGQAGASELLLNPWARTIGLNLMNTAYVRGIEAMSLNVAGLSRINKMEIGLAHSIYLQGAGLGVNTVGLAQRMGENGAFGVMLHAMNFGQTPITVENLPEGTGATFSPSFFNLGISYAHTFDKKVSVGLTLRLISETVEDVSAFGFALDAGVQYVTGDEANPERFKFGIALRNIGSPMRFGGQGLNVQEENPAGDNPFLLTYSKQAADFELPSSLSIGASYDIIPDKKSRLTAIGNFTSNSFSRDELGGGLEFSYNELFALRGSYRYEVGVAANSANRSVYTGFGGGVSVSVPFNKKGDQRLIIDYGYLTSNPWNGTHNISLKVSL